MTNEKKNQIHARKSHMVANVFRHFHALITTSVSDRKGNHAIMIELPVIE